MEVTLVVSLTFLHQVLHVSQDEREHNLSFQEGDILVNVSFDNIIEADDHWL